MSRPEIIRDVAHYYSEKLRLYGPSPQGVDWNGPESQQIRYFQMERLFGDSRDKTITDVGCGYGGFFLFLRARGHLGRLIGTDLSANMIEAAQTQCVGLDPIEFKVANGPVTPTDFITASGIFSVKLGKDDEAWLGYLLETLTEFNSQASQGFAFNCLTKYSEISRMRSHLYYADPLFLFDYCKRHFSQNVALLHDYGLYEFTILVRK